MQIIQGIRDKGAAIVIVVITLSLIGFILMDAKQGSNQMFGSTSANIGKVNGDAITQGDFSKRVKLQEAQEQQQQGGSLTPARSAQVREQVWNQIIAEKVFYAEADKLGIDFTSKELSSILTSDDPSNPLMQDREMIDPQTGKLDMSKVSLALNNIKKMKGEQRDMIDAQIIEPQKLTSISTKYYSLLNASVYYPSWMQEADVADAKNFAEISYVAVPYTVITDSTIKVTDAEIEKYVSSHKDLFKQEAGRMISYVAFSQLPNAADSARTRELVTTLKEEFAGDVNVKNFLARNTSAIDFDTNYLPKSKISSRYIDSITRLSAGSVYGPYVDNGSYVIAKYLGSKTMPDSVSAKHILIATVNSQTGEPILEDSVAKKRADSILAAVNGGANFAALALQYSSDGSKVKGGDLGTFGYGTMVPEFNNFTFNKPVGTRGVVRTQFGYHIIEVTNQKSFSPAYKIGFLAKEIIPSEETINMASLEATKLAAEKNAANFEAYIQKNGLQKITNPTLIKENDVQIGQLQDGRQLVRWIFGAKKGEVSDPYSVGDQFIVALVDNVQKEGTQNVETARPMAEGAIRDEKKAAEISKKLGSNPTLESAATAYGKEVLTAGADSSITFTSQIINNIGFEPRLLGVTFNKQNLNKTVGPIIGKTGVYVMKVNSISQKAPNTAEETTQFKEEQISNIRSKSVGNWFEGLRKKAKIKDNRSTFY